MFGDLYAIARHTPLHLIITPRGEQLSIIVMPKPTGEAASQQALTKPLSIVGTPAELEAEFTAAIGKYTHAVNELRSALDLPLDALEEARKKAAKKDAAKADKETKKEAEARARSEAAKKGAATRAEKAAAAKKAREAKAAEKKRAREAALKKRRAAAAARKAAKPQRSIQLPGEAKSARPSTPKPAPANNPAAARHLASKPGKPECIADYRELQAKVSEPLTRRGFIKRSKTRRRYEKLWKNWEAFIADAKGARSSDRIERDVPSVEAAGSNPAERATTDQPNSRAVREQSAETPDSAQAELAVREPKATIPASGAAIAEGRPPATSAASPEAAAPEPASAPAAPRFEIRDDATGELICMATEKPGLADWIEVPPFVDGKFARARVVSVSPFRDGGVYTVEREQTTERTAA